MNDMIKLWQNPSADDVGNSTTELLQGLAKPTMLHFSGRDASRCRVVTTLLHGNEPSGLDAIHRWIKADLPSPAVDIYFFIASVKAALEPPGFYFRYLQGHRDLNRCFRPPFDDHEGLLAKALLDEFEALKPECVIDIHNTSGAGPSFAVSIAENPRHDAIATLFTHRLIVADVFLGALMEVATDDLPIVTIECGGVEDPHAAELAYEGLCNFFNTEDIFSTVTPHHFLERLVHPVRLELKNHFTLTFSPQAQKDFDFTIREDIEHLNFQTIDPTVCLGWLSNNDLNIFNVRDGNGNDVLSHYFQERNGGLYPTQTLKLFMATGNPEIAKSDCLFYISKISDVIIPQV